MREIHAKSNSSADKAFELLDKLATDGRAMSAAQVCEYLGVTKATAYSLLRSGLDKNYIERDPRTGRFGLGWKFYEYGMAYRYQFPFLPAAARLVQQTAYRLSVRCVVYVCRDGRAIQILVVDNSPMPEMAWGYSFPVWACASGRLMMAHMDRETLEKELKKPRTPITQKTVTDEVELRRLIEEAKRQNFSMEHGEINPDRTCLSAPVYDRAGEMLATICFQVSPKRYEKEGEALTQEVKLLAARISADLGYQAIR